MITYEQLEKLQGHSQREIAKELGVSQATIRWWLRKYNISTKPKIKEYRCLLCGEISPANFYGHSKEICKSCFNVQRMNSFTKTRLKVVQEFGGKCAICGYNKYIGALDFHHLDPSEKDKSFRRTWSYKRLKLEAQKCVLLCSNCHREVEAGITIYPHGEAEIALVF